MHYSALLCCLAAWCLVLANAGTLSSIEKLHWNNFKISHGKAYKSIEEEQMRQQTFLKNLRDIETHNKQYSEGKTTYKLKMNKFADLTKDELNEMLNGNVKRMSNSLPASVYKAPANEKLPASVDWREKGAVTKAKNQGSCGSCWAFAAVAALEGAHFLKTGELVSLSEQNLMDCASAYGPKSCGGGNIDDAYRFIIDNGGVDTEDSYPYEERNAPCRFKKETVGATLSNYTLVQAHSESDLQSAVANFGPVAASICMSFAFPFYDSGVFYGPDCDPDRLEHGVTIVGYGTSSEGDYWIVKNSMGEDWGENGFIRMARNRDNNCGIATKAVIPIV